MPRSLQAWYSRDDLEIFADRETVLSGEVPLSKLTRLDGLVHTDRSSAIAVTLVTERSSDARLLLTLTLRGTLVLSCQRCLDPFAWRIDEQTKWVVVDSDVEAAHSEAGAASLVLDEGRLGVEALLEDELIVALPLAPRHESIDECGPLAQNLSAVLSDATADQVVGSRDV